MSNMSYCRFENTVADLQDCYDNLFESELSKRETEARKELIQICRDIVQDTQDEEI